MLGVDFGAIVARLGAERLRVVAEERVDAGMDCVALARHAEFPVDLLNQGHHGAAFAVLVS
jgi:hypothetical protein